LRLQLQAFLASMPVARGLQWLPDVRRLWMPMLIFVLSLSGVAVAADALVVTEREQLETFLDDVTRPRLDERLDGALAYVDSSTQPCRLQQAGVLREFSGPEQGELSEAIRTALSVFDGAEQNLLQHSERIDGERASVTTRLGDSGYEQTVIYDLIRRDNRWLVRSVRTL
jgi:hypothetical protein